MTWEIVFVMALTGCAVVLFVTEKLATDMVAMLVMVALLVSGVLTPAEGLAGFANTATITVGAMFVLAAMRREPLRLVAGGLRWALLLGLFQFTLNFGFVYNAESYITSGLVAVMFALLVVPNAIFGRIFLGQPITGAFVLGSAIAALGVVERVNDEAAGEDEE